MALTKVSKSVISDNAIDADKLAVTGNGNSGELLASSGDGTFQWTSGIATELYTDNAIAALVDSAPGALDTLNELAAALGDDANFSTTVTNALATKIDGTGTTNYVMKWLDSNTATNSSIFDNGTNVGIGTSSPTAAKLVIQTSGDQSIYGSTDGGYNVLEFTSDNGTTVGGLNAYNGLIKIGTANGIGSLTGSLNIDSSGNVGIGTSSPTTSYNRALHINDPANSSAELHITAGSGTTSNDGLSIIQSGVTSFVYNRESGNMLFGTSNTERMRIDSNGVVGIGETATTSFDGVPRLIVGGGSSDSGIAIFTGSTNAGYLQFADGTSGAEEYRGFIKYDHSLNSMSFSTNSGSSGRNESEMTIDSSGRVGIGTSSPSIKTHIVGSGEILRLETTVARGGGSNTINFNDPTGNKGYLGYGSGVSDVFLLWQRMNEPILFGANNAERMRITSSGNVGIGTSAPGAKLQVVATANGYSGVIEAKSTYTSSSFFSAFRSKPSDGNGDPNSGLWWGAISADHAIISSGNIYRSAGNFRPASTTASSIGMVNGSIGFSTNDSLTADTDFIPTQRMLITSTGNVGIGTSSPSTKLQVAGTVTATALTETSALRFKENIQEDIDASIIDKLRPVSYDWKEDKKKDYGFIAEEVNELDSTLTTQDEEGEMIGIKYTKLIPFLVKKIQEQEERIKQLENGKS